MKSKSLKTARVCGTAVAALLAGSWAAGAADMPVKAYGPPPLPAWAGLYIGVAGGGTWGNDQWRSDETVPVAFGSVGLNPSGWTAGGILGANFQQGNLVIGPEFDVSWVSASDTATLTSGATTITGATDIKLTAHARTRLGYAYGNWLPFIAGGAAVARTTQSFTSSTAGIAGTSDNVYRVGFTIGAGVDWMYSPNLLVRVEYLYDNYGVTSVPGSGAFTGTFFDTEAFRMDMQTVRAALIWKFSDNVVTARY